MGLIDEIHGLVNDFSDKFNFLCVYISEAHASDEWPVGNLTAEYQQPTSLDQRVAVASDFRRDTQFRVPLVVDTLDDAFETKFGAWPLRLYVVSADGRVTHVAMPDACPGGGAKYLLGPVRAHMQAMAA